MGNEQTEPSTSKETTRGAPLREYYLGLGSASADSSLETLAELIVALAPDDSDRQAPSDGASAVSQSVSVVICVSSRDTLDDVVYGLSSIGAARHHLRVNLWTMHSDMLEREVTSYANEFREVARSREVRNELAEDFEDEEVPRAPPPDIVNVLVTTDSPLKTLSKLNSDPLGPALLIHYSLPRRREDYSRRKSVVLGSRKSSTGSQHRVAVCFVHAGRLDELHAFESMAERSLLEMPVHVKDIFAFR